MEKKIEENYEENFDGIRSLISNGEKTIERTIFELQTLLDRWRIYSFKLDEFVRWFNEIEENLSNISEENVEEFENFLELLAVKDRQLEELEDLEKSIGDFDWSRQAQNSSTLRQKFDEKIRQDEKLSFLFLFRLKIFFSQCQNRCERAEQIRSLNRRWTEDLAKIQDVFRIYGENLIEIRHEETQTLISLDKIQVEEKQNADFSIDEHFSFRFSECSTIEKSIGKSFERINKFSFESKRIKVTKTKKKIFFFSRSFSFFRFRRELKIQLNELNDLFSTIDQDLRTRRQACELVETCLDEIQHFLDEFHRNSSTDEILSANSIKNLRVKINSTTFDFVSPI